MQTGEEEAKRKFKNISKIIQPMMDGDFLSPYISKRNEKDPKTLDYLRTRYLDAWAKLVNIQKPCSAVIQPNIAEKTLYVTFNEIQKNQKNVINTINLVLMNYTLLDEVIAVFFICDFRVKSKELKGKIRLVKNKDDWTIFFKENVKLINDVKDSLDYREIAKEIERNVTKLHNNSLLDFKIYPEPIENKNKLHAEIIASEYLLDKEEEKQEVIKYVGISRLSCYICDQTLKQWKLDHRGTHGKLYAVKYIFSKRLDSDFIKKIVSDITEYFSDNYHDTCQRVIQYNRIIYEDRISEIALSSDDESWQDSVEFSGTSTTLELPI